MLFLSSENSQVNQQLIKQEKAYHRKKQKDVKYKKPSGNYKQVSSTLNPLDKNDTVSRSI